LAGWSSVLSPQFSILSGVILALWAVFFVQTLVNLRLTHRLRSDQTPCQRPVVSIVIPARNEERVIDQSVRAFLAQDYGNFEVIVVNDRSTDATGTDLHSIEDPRLTIIDGSETPAGWLGKPWALEQGALRARGELLLFVDADLIYAPSALRAAVAEIESDGAGLIGLWPRLEMGTLPEQIAMPMLSFFGFCILPLWLADRSRAVRLAIGGGSGNLVHRSLLDRIGGFRALSDSVVDDVALARHARRQGERTHIVRADDLISVRMYHGTREINEGFTKNVFTTVGRSYVFGAANLAAMFFFHIAPYILALTGNRLAIATVVMITLTRVVLFRSLRFRLDNAIFFHPLMVAFWAYIFLRSMWFTGVRNELRWRGRVYNAAETRFGAER
jgi:chlorobactene glucosyltransferase